MKARREVRERTMATSALEREKVDMLGISTMVIVESK